MFQRVFRNFHPNARSLRIFDGFRFGGLGAAVNAQLARKCEPGGDSLQIWNTLVPHPRLFHGTSGCGVLCGFLELLELLSSKLIVSRFDGVVRYRPRVRSSRGDG